VPLVAMTYLNHLVVRGTDRFLGLLADAGVAGCIVPDLPVAEADDHLAAARRAGLEATLMLGPNTPDDVAELICRRSQGFIYVMSVLATTGSSAPSGPATWRVAERARSRTGRPVLIGFGIDGPRRAVEAARHADGVVVASALMRQVLAGAPIGEVAGTVAGIRAALDGGPPR
jgi:tryptophan synthase alpha chain